MKKVKVGNIAKIFNGYSFKSTEYSEVGFQVIRITNVQNGYISNDNQKFIELKNKSLEKFILNEGDILISLTGNVGRVGKIGKENLPAVLNQRVGKVIVQSKEVISDYLFHILKSDVVESKLIENAKGIAQKNIGSSDIENIEIPLPSLEDQKRIVKILDRADALRQKRKQTIGLLDEYLKSMFLEMFGDPVKNEKGWEVKMLKDLTTKLGDGLHGTPKFSDTGDYYFINGNNLENGKIIIKDSTKRVGFEEFKKYQKPLDATSMLVSINGTLGRVAFYKNEKIILGKSACYFNVKRDVVNSIYLYNILQSDFFLKYADQNSTGSTIRNVSLKTMREFPVIYPPLNMQNMFGDIVAKNEKVKALMLAQSAELENHFRVLMQRAFKGEL